MAGRRTPEADLQRAVVARRVAADFIHRALDPADDGAAMLVRTAFLEGTYPPETLLEGAP